MSSPSSLQNEEIDHSLYMLAEMASSYFPLDEKIQDFRAGPDQSSPSCCAISISTTDFTSLHINCARKTSPTPSPKPLKRSSTSNSAPIGSTCLETPKPKVYSRHHAKSVAAAKSSSERKIKRQELKERAQRIRTVENSPVNQQQLLVLRMVFDQITMYPTETWMALIAVIIHRALKQVRNWFSNERPKHKGEEDVVRLVSSEGERLRLRPAAVEYCKAEDWTDSFFEEVVMIYHFKIMAKLRRDQIRRLTSDVPKYNLP